MHIYTCTCICTYTHKIHTLSSLSLIWWLHLFPYVNDSQIHIAPVPSYITWTLLSSKLSYFFWEQHYPSSLSRSQCQYHPQSSCSLTLIIHNLLPNLVISISTIFVPPFSPLTGILEALSTRQYPPDQSASLKSFAFPTQSPNICQSAGLTTSNQTPVCGAEISSQLPLLTFPILFIIQYSPPDNQAFLLLSHRALHFPFPYLEYTSTSPLPLEISGFHQTSIQALHTNKAFLVFQICHLLSLLYVPTLHVYMLSSHQNRM